MRGAHGRSWPTGCSRQSRRASRNLGTLKFLEFFSPHGVVLPGTRMRGGARRPITPHRRRPGHSLESRLLGPLCRGALRCRPQFCIAISEGFARADSQLVHGRHRRFSLLGDMDPECHDLFFQRRGLRLHGLTGGCDFLYQCGVLLGRLIHLHHRRIHLINPAGLLLRGGADLGDEEDARVRGRAFAAKALELNEKSSLAHAIVALQQFDDLNVGRRTSDFETVIAGYERALELDPKNANALNWQGLVYTYVGDNERAAASHRRCIEVDPALAACRSNLAIELISLGRLDEASAVVDAALDAGAFAQGPGQIILFAELKRPDAFKLMAISLPALRGLRKFDSLYDAMTDPGDDKALAAEIKTLLAANKASARIGVLLNALGDFEEPPLIIAHWGAVMRAYRRSPAFKAHSRASGVDAYWRRHGFPPQCKPVGPQTADSGDFECE